MSRPDVVAPRAHGTRATGLRFPGPWLCLRLCLVLVGAAGCSVVFDASDHRGDAGEAPSDADPPDAGPPDAGAPDAGPPEVSAVQFCPRYVESYCAARIRCCTEDGAAAETVEACATRMVVDCYDAIGEYVTDTRSAYRAERGAELVAAIDAAAASCDVGVLPNFRPPALRTLMAGTIPVDGACGEPTLFACNEPAWCVRQPLLARACQVEPAQEGERCFVDLECAPGLRCDRSLLGSERCAPMLEQDMACRRSEECLSRLCGGTGASAVCVPVNIDRVFCPSPFDATVGNR